MESKPVQKVGVVIPIYNPNREFVSVLKALASQTYPISRVVVIDSSPDMGNENNIELVQNYCGCSDRLYLRILPEEFDHGKTRNLGVSKLTDLDAVVFLTQDGVMSADCIEKLVYFLNKNTLAGVYARQLPREGATELEIIERRLTYPSTSRINEGLPGKIDDVLLSNVCSLMRMDAFMAVGGFPTKIITAEDIVIATELLRSGYKTGYCADATLKHSHNLSFFGIVRRYFDTGVMHAEWENMIPFKTARGKGAQLVQDEIRHIIRTKPSELSVLVMSVLGKVIGYYLGRKNSILSTKLQRRFSQNKNFWIN